MAWFLVWQGQDVVPHDPRANIYISPFTGGNGGVISLDSESSGLETTRQVGQCSCVHKLSHNAGSRLRKPSDEVEKAEAVSPKTRDVLVVNEVLSFKSEVVIFFPVAANRQNIARAFY